MTFQENSWKSNHGEQFLEISCKDKSKQIILLKEDLRPKLQPYF